MKIAQEYLKALVFFLGLMYIVGSFTVWDINPGNWDEAGRAMGVLFSLIGALVYLAIKNGCRHE